MDWDGLQVFLALARRGSLRGASEALDVSHSTVSRRLAALEQNLGTRLFDTTPEGMRLSDAGRRIEALVASVESSVYDIERTIAGEDERVGGRIRLTLPLPMLTGLIMPALVDFSRRYPQIDLDVDARQSLVDLSRREADVAIRVLRPGATLPETMLGRQLGYMPRAVFGSPEYLASHDLADPHGGASWIGWAEGESWPAWVRETPFPHLPTRHGFDDPSAQVAAVKAGLGIGLLPTAVGGPGSGLVQVPGTPPLPGYDVWMLSHPDLRDTTRVRLLRDHLAAVFAAGANGLESPRRED